MMQPRIKLFNILDATVLMQRKKTKGSLHTTDASIK